MTNVARNNPETLFRDKREKLIDDGSKWSSVSNTLNMDPENLLPVNPPLVGPQ